MHVRKGCEAPHRKRRGIRSQFQFGFNYVAPVGETLLAATLTVKTWNNDSVLASSWGTQPIVVKKSGEADVVLAGGLTVLTSVFGSVAIRAFLVS